jgi:uncharacterized protein YutE (UPF0331/DUF86 family)
MTDNGRLRGLLIRIGDELEHLRRLSALSAEDLQRDPDILAAVKYGFVVAIEASIDSARMVALSQGLRAATSFADSFIVLGESDHLDADLVERLKDMARFRDLLVHGYATVDDNRVIEILQTRLEDLEAFRRSLARAASR